MPPSEPHSRTSSPPRLMMGEGQHYGGLVQTTPPPTTTSSLTPPPATCATRKWSCLDQDQLDPTVPSWAEPPTVRAPPLPAPHGDPSPYSAALPVERWAHNVSRYYSSQGASLPQGMAAANEELSELESLYQASLLAPSMQRGSGSGSRHSPQTTRSRPGRH